MTSSHSVTPPPLAHLIRRKRSRPSVANDHQRAKSWPWTFSHMLACLNSRPSLACGPHEGCSVLWEKRSILFMMTTGGQAHVFGYAWGHPSSTQKVHSYKTDRGCSCPLSSLLRAGPMSTPLGFLVTAYKLPRRLTMVL